MPLSSRFLAEARREFRDQVSSYAASDPSVAARFTNAVEAAVGLVCAFPGAGPPYHGSYRRRVLGRPFRFSIIYTVEADSIVVAAVWAHRRDPEKLRQRLERIEPESGS